MINKRKFSGMIIYAQHSELNFSKGDYGKPGTKGEGGDKGKAVFSIAIMLTCCQVLAFFNRVYSMALQLFFIILMHSRFRLELDCD